jgi:hypothetical protein
MCGDRRAYGLVALRQLHRALVIKSDVLTLNEVRHRVKENLFPLLRKVFGPGSTAIGYQRIGPIWSRENGPIARRH